MKLKTLDKKIVKLRDFSHRHVDLWLDEIEDQLHRGDWQYIKISEDNLMLTDAPDEFIQTLKEEFNTDACPEYEKCIHLTDRIHDKGYGIIWDDRLNAWFPDNIFDKYLDEEDEE